MMRFTKRNQIAILLLVVGILCIIGYNVIIRNDAIVVVDNDNQNTDENQESTEKDNSIDEMIMVDITGAIHKPGTVTILKGSRLQEAVDQLGGLTDEADRDRINLAIILDDQQKIHIPKIGEEVQDVIDSSSDYNSGYTNGKININRASKEVLSQLPGIGEVIAQRIVEYRKNKKFESIEELKNVSGIGTKKFNEIKNLITAN